MMETGSVREPRRRFFASGDGTTAVGNSVFVNRDVTSVAGPHLRGRLVAAVPRLTKLLVQAERPQRSEGRTTWTSSEQRRQWGHEDGPVPSGSPNIDHGRRRASLSQFASSLRQLSRTEPWRPIRPIRRPLADAMTLREKACAVIGASPRP
jgi:hypothetical protein